MKREYLIRLRQLRGASQRDVLKGITDNISHALYSQIESGGRSVSQKLLQQLAEYFGVSYNELLRAEMEYRERR